MQNQGDFLEEFYLRTGAAKEEDISRAQIEVAGVR
jgi:hypothetical protein